MDDSFLTELYKDIPKLGTGSPRIIRQVFERLQLPLAPTILDVGCATGMSSIELARISEGSILALDINQTYLDILKEKAKAQNVSDRIRTTRQNMFSMEFEEGAFNVIWAENVIFRIGIKGALKSWRRFLKKRGYIVLSTIVRLKDDVPDEARDYWESSYPGVTTHAKIEKVIEKQGYRLVDSILIPTAESMEYCYQPLEKRIKELRKIHGPNEE